MVYRRLVSPLSTVVSKAFESLEAFRSANARKYSDKESAITRNISWQAPMNGFFKVNWDAAVDEDNKNMSNGVIVKDSIGEVLATLLVPKDYITEPNNAEATAVLRTLDWN